MTRQVHLCSCNRTMPFAASTPESTGASAFARAASEAGAASVHTYDAMCQHELARFADAVEGDAIVACTQESRLLGDTVSDSAKVSTVRFFNVERSQFCNAQTRRAHC
jgi:hypothetical protein